MTFREKLISELTQSDIRQSKRKGYNRYALGLYFQAADAAMAEIEKGQSPEFAFRERFNPTREMHRIARNLGLGLDVERGQWIYTDHTYSEESNKLSEEWDSRNALQKNCDSPI